MPPFAADIFFFAAFHYAAAMPRCFVFAISPPDLLPAEAMPFRRFRFR
jgi:hypothetical protein